MRGMRRDGQRSQALIEFALVSPVLLLLLFGVIDIGRAIFYYDTLNHAAREGARVAEGPPNNSPPTRTVLTRGRARMLAVRAPRRGPKAPAAPSPPPQTPPGPMGPSPPRP